MDDAMLTSFSDHLSFLGVGGWEDAAELREGRERVKTIIITEEENKFFTSSTEKKFS